MLRFAKDPQLVNDGGGVELLMLEKLKDPKLWYSTVLRVLWLLNLCGVQVLVFVEVEARLGVVFLASLQPPRPLV
jgi:hypothetical protein